MVLAAMAGAAPLRAQATLRGRVVEDSGRMPIRSAQVGIAALGLATMTDSLGAFRLTGVRFGTYRVVVRALGFAPDSSVVEVDADALEVRDIRLHRQAQALAGVTVEDKAVALAARISGFEERRRIGVGTFIDRSMLARFDTRRTDNVLAALAPGVSIRHGSGLMAWVATTRGGGNQFQPESSDGARGARPACYMDIYLNGALVFANSRSTNRQAQLFDVNSLRPEDIESIEVYAGISQLPAQYNKTGGGCGVILIWTRVS